MIHKYRNAVYIFYLHLHKHKCPILLIDPVLGQENNTCVLPVLGQMGKTDF